MKCKKCGVDIPDGSKFCHSCGKKQTEEKKRSNTSRPNGTGSVYKRGSTWECCVTLGYISGENGKNKPVRRTKGGFRTKKEAMEYIPNLRREKVREVPTLYQLHERYLASNKYEKLSASRKEKYRIAWGRMKDLQFYKIDALTTFDLQDTVDCSTEKYYPARDMKDLFSMLYQTAMPDNFVTQNLSEFIELPELNPKEQDSFTTAEVEKLWTHYASGSWWTGYILLMIYTGMMPGELLACRKSSINWDEKIIDGEGLKTEKRRKTPIVLADIMIPVLQDLCTRTDNDKLIRIQKDRFYSVYYSEIEKAGCRKLPPYTCRHTAATALVLKDVQPSIIQKVMRHAKFSTTEKYIHVDLNPMLEAVNKLKSKKESAKPPQ